MGRTQDALAHLMAIDPPAVAHYNLACLLHQRGQSQAAGQHFAQAATLDPSLVMGEWAARLGAMPAQSQPVGPRLTNVRVVDPSANYSRAASYQPAVNTQPTANFQPNGNLQFAAIAGGQSAATTATARAPDVGMPAHDMRWPQASAADEVQGSWFGSDGIGRCARELYRRTPAAVAGDRGKLRRAGECRRG